MWHPPHLGRPEYQQINGSTWLYHSMKTSRSAYLQAHDLASSSPLSELKKRRFVRVVRRLFRLFFCQIIALNFHNYTLAVISISIKSSCTYPAVKSNSSNASSAA